MVDVGIPYQLTQWKIFEVRLQGHPGKTRHIAGFSFALRVPRITGPIVEFDLAKRRGTDESGRQFSLIGLSRASADVEPAWQTWVSQNQAQDVKDVSREVTKLLITLPGTELDWREEVGG
jgi:hypothetical protein